jgi:hypothetical protein
MTSSRYKGISWHKGIQKFVVQVQHRKQKVYKAFKEERDGVHFLMKLKRLPEARLLRNNEGALCYFSSYRGVAWHRGNRKWEARCMC